MLDSPNLGLVKLPALTVIHACEKTIERIKQARLDAKEKYIDDYLEQATKRWEKSWFKWLRAKPTWDDAFEHYLHGDGWWSEADRVENLYLIQERNCAKILTAAKQSCDTYIWLSPEAVEYCCL